MSKELTYFEAMEEILKDKSKKFKSREEDIMFFNEDINSLSIKLYALHTMNKLVVNDNWYNTKWILIEEKKTYNVRVYDTISNKLLKSENVSMTEDEMKKYCKSKVIWEEENILDGRNNVLVTLDKGNSTRVECEEIITS